MSGIINKTAWLTDKSTNALIYNDNVQCILINHLINKKNKYMKELENTSEYVCTSS